jgi:hypothetical protein
LVIVLFSITSFEFVFIQISRSLALSLLTRTAAYLAPKPAEPEKNAVKEEAQPREGERGCGIEDFILHP